MGMNLKIATAVLALHWVSAIHAEVPVFGVPFGGVLSKPLKVCNSDIDKRPDLCWTGKPGLEKSGMKSGGVSIPEKGLPDWALHQSFQMWMSPNGTVQSIVADLGADCNVHKIARSVSSRFGTPTEDRLTNLLMTARWETPEIRISLLSTGKTCSLNAMTIKHAQELQAIKDKEQAKRPGSL